MTEAATPLDQQGSGAQSAPCQYINHIDLSYSLSEVRITFGQIFADSDAVRLQCRLVTSPVHLRRMGQEITATINSYETRFGIIPLSHGEDGDG
jgi:hypothetical protein